MTTCSGFTFLRYLACWNRDATHLASASAADACQTVATSQSASSGTIHVHRSNLDHGITLFACDNTAGDCSDVFGDAGGETASNTTGNEPTEKERWVLVDIADTADTSRMVTDSSATASAALIYPPGFTDAGVLGLWWSTNEPGVETIRHKKATSTSWQRWNDYTGWDTEVDVAEEPSGTPSGSFQECTHPWVAPMDDGTSKNIRLFLQCGPEGAYEIRSVDSSSGDEEGTDFDLGCTVGAGCTPDGDTCANGDPCDWDRESISGSSARTEMCADGTSSCFYLEGAAHGRIAWDYVTAGALDFDVDEPMMVFTGGEPTSCKTLGEDGAGDIFTATWSPSTEWDVPTSGTCPQEEEDDRHDPAVIPLPNGEFKMYYLEDNAQFYVIYWDGDSWGDEQPIELFFDDGTPSGTEDAALHACLQNVDALVRVIGGVVHEAQFYRALPETGCFTTDGGIVYAEHQN